MTTGKPNADIPSDVKDTAWKCYFDRCEATLKLAEQFEEEEVIDLLCRAILAAKAEQREADAKLADAEYENKFNDAGRHIAGRIARAIRKGAL